MPAACSTLLRLVRYRMGGHAGNGRQYISWIHEEDFIRAVQWIIADDTFSGAVQRRVSHVR